MTSSISIDRRLVRNKQVAGRQMGPLECGVTHCLQGVGGLTLLGFEANEDGRLNLLLAILVGEDW